MYMKRRPVLTIRPFCAQDADRVGSILRSSPEASPWSIDDLLRFSENAFGQRAIFLVCESSGEVTAFLMARTVGDEAELLNIAVSPAHRCSGQATQLLKCAMDQLRGSAVHAIFLEVRESNMPARAFYEKHGFSVSGKRPNYYQRPDEAAVSMMRKLTASLS
jgi:ribosomal-protein-alanine N-acetyltransferase